jgi:predicted nucleotidyltransferase
MRLSDGLDDLLQSRSHIRVLRAMDRLPSGIDVSTREIARHAGVSHPTASSVLQSLSIQGVVLARKSLWADEYRLNEHDVSRSRLRGFKWEGRLQADLIAVLSAEIRKRAPWVSSAYLFGSAARADMKADSDLDLAVICPASQQRKMQRIGEELGELTHGRYGNRVSLTAGTRPIEVLAESGRPGYRLWRQVAKDGTELSI